MGEETVTISENEGRYEIKNNGMSEFALIGLLECILFDLKTAGRRISIDNTAAVAPEALVLLWTEGLSTPAGNFKWDFLHNIL